MKKFFTSILLFIFLTPIIFAQVSINTSLTPPASSSMLDVSSDSLGILLPRMLETDRNTIISPEHSLMVYQTDQISGYYYNSGSQVSPQWVRIAASPNGADCESRIPITVLPYNITNSGSYYLTKDLSGGGGIKVTASYVTIDLNGFSLNGAGIASSGIDVVGVHNVIILNGFINGWDGTGIEASSSTEVSILGVHTAENQGDGINTGKNSIISNCTSQNNLFDGYAIGENNAIKNCIAAGNGGDGINSQSNSSIELCSSSGNTGYGIKMVSNGTIQKSSAGSNGESGFYIGSGGVANECASSGNSQHGFMLVGNTTVKNNNSTQNMKYGYLIPSDGNLLNGNHANANVSDAFFVNGSYNRLDGNYAASNGGVGFHTSSNNNTFIRNEATNSTLGNFTIAGVNMVATIVTLVNINTNTNPYANISY